MFLLLIVGPYYADDFKTFFPEISLGFFRYLGLLPIILGIPLSLVSAYLIFIPGQGRAVPYESENDFTPSGPYKYIRNPFLLGCLLILWGEVIFFESTAMASYTFIVSWCVIFWVHCCEEPSLEERYGEEYLLYKRSTPCWLPIKKHKSKEKR